MARNASRIVRSKAEPLEESDYRLKLFVVFTHPEITAVGATEKELRAAGIEVPILPGIMPVTNVEQIQRITAMSGAHVPAGLGAALKARQHDPEAALQMGVAYAALQCADLLRGGAPGIHFYTLNRSTATRAILSALRALEPWREA